jgi:hypothetical protein
MDRHGQQQGLVGAKDRVGPGNFKTFGAIFAEGGQGAVDHAAQRNLIPVLLGQKVMGVGQGA